MSSHHHQFTFEIEDIIKFFFMVMCEKDVQYICEKRGMSSEDGADPHAYAYTCMCLSTPTLPHKRAHVFKAT